MGKIAKRQKNFLKKNSKKRSFQKNLTKAQKRKLAVEKEVQKENEEVQKEQQDVGYEVDELEAESSGDEESESGEDSSDEESEEEEGVKKPTEFEKIESLSKKRWLNKQRVLIFGSRGINAKMRYFMDDLLNLLPHSKTDVKFNKQSGLQQCNEIAEIKNCQNIFFLEARKKKDTFLWLSPAPDKGPSVRFLLENVHTMSELRFSGNCLKTSRPILSFHDDFNTRPHLQLIRRIIEKSFNTPRYHPKSQPFIDHVFNFSILDDKIWFRNYQILPDTKDIIEIGPRFTLTPACVFSGSFRGEKIWTNSNYVSPNERRRMVKQMKMNAGGKDPIERVKVKIAREQATQGMEKYKLDGKDEVFA